MIKRLLLVLGIVVSLSSCGEDIAYRIEGKLQNLEDQTIYAVFENDGNNVVDTVVCEKPGEFLIERKDGNFREATLFFENKVRLATIYLEKGEKVTITGDVTTPSLLQIKGGRINDKLTEMRKEAAPLLKQKADLLRILHADSKDSLKNHSIEDTDIASRLTNVEHQLSEHAMASIQEYPDEEASAVLIGMHFANPDDTRKMDELLALLNPKLKESYLVKRLEEYSIRAKRTAIGAEAPNFQVKNVYGTPISLDSFSRKYLLLTFTAPWCDMCQTESLCLDEVFSKYPKEKLDMLLVSLDDNPKEVRKLLAKDSIAWNLVTDSAGQAAMLINLYNVSALPRCFLIDEEGTIVLKTDNGIEVKQTLENLMN